MKKGIPVKRHGCISIKKPTFSFSQLIRGVLLLVLTLFVTACANTSTATPAPTATTTTMAAQLNAVPTMANVEETPVSGAVTVHVTLEEFSVTSSVTTFRVGVPYYFIIANSGHDVHEFLILPGKIDGKQLPTNQQLNNDLVEIEPIGPGTTQRLNYTFAASAVGQGGIVCLMRGHYMAGMHLSIKVTR